ncbi:thiamine diphosphate-binding protein [Syncephalis pseudoplumigaleata]|uniref:2-hydroxyacyl-CoA lyase n=1 Tax=Syncephalis pseudoplumigaleata TaxID=1712513 RepID=A0A4P9YWV6_9FUNG|nr:thiamine diphosphate-binding protein [Syncephalis pseudoplumigaleata]|eukprot:RKP24345.1 thiamine diphosphate-binding protein [Syncephalis pseudoplumigaleata]
MAERMAQDCFPLDYYPVFGVIQPLIPSDALLISEGANTMDIARSTAARYRLPLIVIVINNNGIYYGLDKDGYEQRMNESASLPSFTLLPEARYELMAEAFHGKGYLCRTKPDIEAAMTAALQEKERISVINILITNGDPTGKLAFAWQDQPKV